MKSSRVVSCVFLAVIILLSAFVLFEHQKQAAKNNQAGEPAPSAETNVPASKNHILTSSNASSSVGKIVSDVTTTSNRIVVVERDGVKKTGYIPLTLARALTDEQIVDSLFPPNRPPKKSNGNLSQHLSFYGLTVDDQTNVLAGVTITGTVLVVDGQKPGHHVPVNTVSGGDGHFQVDVDYGQLIAITVSKTENYISPPSQEFRYGSGSYGPTDSTLITNPDVANPIVFVLTKKKKTEPLIELRKGLTAPNTGEPVRIDVTTGNVVPTGGDLIVSITCPEPFKAGVHIPWKLVLQATDGGLVTIRDGQLDYLLNNNHEAPTSGYDEIVIDHPKDDPNWDSQYDSILYLKSRNGQIYGKLSFSMHVGWDERGVPFGFHSFVNTNASRNLQGVSR